MNLELARFDTARVEEIVRQREDLMDARLHELDELRLPAVERTRLRVGEHLEHHLRDAERALQVMDDRRNEVVPQALALPGVERLALRGADLLGDVPDRKSDREEKRQPHGIFRERELRRVRYRVEQADVNHTDGEGSEQYESEALAEHADQDDEEIETEERAGAPVRE